jgi:hypothetical protein
MSGPLFPLRLAARTLAVAGAPFLTGARDQLSHYEKEPPHSPVEALGEFLLESLLDARSAPYAEELQRFLEHVLPAASRLYLGRAWLQFSAASGEQGIGLAIFNDKRSVADSFFSYVAGASVAGPAVELARALCRAFPDSAYGQLRAEFRAGAPARLSIFPGWVLEPWRGHGGFERVFARLPAALRADPRIAHARALAQLQAPELFPYGLGVSFAPDAQEPELKLYTTRYDARRSPLRGEGCLQALLETLQLPSAEYTRIHDLHDQLWQAAATKAIQVATSVGANGPQPERVSLLYCGVEAEPAAAALLAAGLPQQALEPLTLFRDRMGVARPMYLGIGVDARGLSARIKVYDAAFFRDTDVGALGRLRPVAPERPSSVKPLIPRRGRAARRGPAAAGARTAHAVPGPGGRGAPHVPGHRRRRARAERAHQGLRCCLLPRHRRQRARASAPRRAGAPVLGQTADPAPRPRAGTGARAAARLRAAHAERPVQGAARVARPLRRRGLGRGAGRAQHLLRVRARGRAADVPRQRS